MFQEGAPRTPFESRVSEKTSRKSASAPSLDAAGSVFPDPAALESEPYGKILKPAASGQTQELFVPSAASSEKAMSPCGLISSWTESDNLIPSFAKTGTAGAGQAALPLYFAPRPAYIRNR